MIILGLLLLLVGWLTGVSLLYTVGSIVLIVGIVFFILGNVGRLVGGRKVWFQPHIAVQFQRLQPVETAE